jgi:hypothetical protein
MALVVVLQTTLRYRYSCNLNSVPVHSAMYSCTVKRQNSTPFRTLINRFIPSWRGSKVILFGLTPIYIISTYGIYIPVYRHPGIYMSWNIYPGKCIYMPVFISRYMRIPVHMRVYIRISWNKYMYILVQRGSFFVFLQRSFIFKGGVFLALHIIRILQSTCTFRYFF